MSVTGVCDNLECRYCICTDCGVPWDYDGDRIGAVEPSYVFNRCYPSMNDKRELYQCKLKDHNFWIGENDDFPSFEQFCKDEALEMVREPCEGCIEWANGHVCPEKMRISRKSPCLSKTKHDPTETRPAKRRCIERDTA